MAYDQFGKDTEMIVQDSSSFAEEGEKLSFLQLQVGTLRCYYMPLIFSAPQMILPSAKEEQTTRSDILDLHIETN